MVTDVLKEHSAFIFGVMPTAGKQLWHSPHIQAARSSIMLETILHSRQCNIAGDFIIGNMTARNSNLESNGRVTLLQLNRLFYCIFCNVTTNDVPQQTTLTLPKN
jgi:hypothetical protein